MTSEPNVLHVLQSAGGCCLHTELTWRLQSLQTITWHMHTITAHPAWSKGTGVPGICLSQPPATTQVTSRHTPLAAPSVSIPLHAPQMPCPCHLTLKSKGSHPPTQQPALDCDQSTRPELDTDRVSRAHGSRQQQHPQEAPEGGQPQHQAKDSPSPSHLRAERPEVHGSHASCCVSRAQSRSRATSTPAPWLQQRGPPRPPPQPCPHRPPGPARVSVFVPGCKPFSCYITTTTVRGKCTKQQEIDCVSCVLALRRVAAGSRDTRHARTRSAP